MGFRFEKEWREWAIFTDRPAKEKEEIVTQSGEAKQPATEKPLSAEADARCGKSSAKDRDVLLLKIRNAVANKEWATANANRDLSQSGSWSCDWYHDVRETESNVEMWFSLLDNGDKYDGNKRGTEAVEP